MFDLQLARPVFFETLVRVHRAGEGAQFTGLKPAGRDLRPEIPAADNAIETGSVESVVKLLTAAIDERLRDSWARRRDRAGFTPIGERFRPLDSACPSSRDSHGERIGNPRYASGPAPPRTRIPKFRRAPRST